MERHQIKEIDLVAFMDSTSYEMPMPEGQPPNEYMEKAPKEVLIIPYGKNPYTIDGKDGEFECDESDADNIIANFAKRGKEIVIDREHSTLNDPQNADAYGWVKILIKKPDGIYGQADWQPETAQKIVEKKLRYLSPVIDFNGSRPNELHSIALTNHPAMHSPNALAASDDSGVVPQKSSLDINMALLNGLKDNTRESLNIIRQCYSDVMAEIKDKPEKMEEFKSFTDGYFPELMLAFADATGAEVTTEANAENFPTAEQQTTIVEVPELERIMNLPKAEAITELETLITLETDPARKQVMVDALNQLEALPEEQAPVVNENIPAPETEPIVQEQAFCDKICTATGLVAKDIDGLIEEIKSFKPVADKSKEFLSIHKFSDFSDATTKILQKEIDSTKKVEVAREVIAMRDTSKSANELVQKALNDKKILAVQKESILRWAMSDYASAEKFIANQKQIFGNTVKNEVQQSISVDKKSPTLALNDLMEKYKKTGSLSYEESQKLVELTSKEM